MPMLIGIEGWHQGRRYPLQDGDTIGRGTGCTVSLGPAESPLFLARFRQDGTDAWLETLLPGIAGPLSHAGTLLDLVDGVIVSFPDAIRLQYLEREPVPTLRNEGQAKPPDLTAGGVPQQRGSAPIPVAPAVRSHDLGKLEDGATTERQLHRSGIHVQAGTEGVSAQAGTEGLRSHPGSEGLRSWMTGMADPGPCAETLPQLSSRKTMPAAQEEELTATLLLCPRTRKRPLHPAGELGTDVAGPVGAESARGPSLDASPSVFLSTQGAASPIPETQLIRKIDRARTAEGALSGPQVHSSALLQGGAGALVCAPRQQESSSMSANLGGAVTGEPFHRAAVQRDEAGIPSEAFPTGPQAGRTGNTHDVLSETDTPEDGHVLGAEAAQPRLALGRKRRSSASWQQALRVSVPVSHGTRSSLEPGSDAKNASGAPPTGLDRGDAGQQSAKPKTFLIQLGQLLRPGLDRSTAYWLLLGLAMGAFLLGARVMLGV